MRLIVTGVKGLVGSRLASILARRGHEVVGVDRGPASPTLDALTRYESLDLTDRAPVMALLRDIRPEVAINCAAMTDVDGCERDPFGAWAVNAEAVATLAAVSMECDAHLLHVSTDYVFDGDAGPYDVDAIANPRGLYALSKHAGEIAVRTLCRPERFTIARTAVVYGWPALGKNNFGSWLVGALGAGQSVKLFSDQWVSPSHATNVAEMLAELTVRRLAGIWHTAGNEVVDRVTFGRLLCKRFGFDPSVIVPSRMTEVNLPSPRPARSGLVVTKTTDTLSAKPWTIAAALDCLFAEWKGSTS
jgi:dTDP-4-dehydrorhamnose reductase